MRSLLLVALCSAMLGACASTPEEDGAEVADGIKRGTSASAFTEAALVDVDRTDGTERCSGAVIAPRLVLTAGHCLVGSFGYDVRVPAAGKRASGRRSWTPYVSTGNVVNPASIDVAVLILDAPIALAFYPPLAAAPVASGTQAVNVGRVRNGNVSSSQLYQGAPVSLVPAAGFPYDYQAEALLQVGDSGGPVYVGSGAARQIVAVNSGTGRTVEVMARVDVVYTQIQELVRQYASP